MKKSGTPYFTRSLLIQASRLGVKWDFNRQLTDQSAEIPNLKYPVQAFLIHHHRHGVRCEPHIRAMISLAPFQDGSVFATFRWSSLRNCPN